jgi:Glycosyltransferase WbsX
MATNVESATARPVRLIAFYLPQFHPIPENDAWWGKGFTEWSNVTRAFPLFAGHQQPRRPTDLGYYDLRLAEVREEQAALARGYGIYGFCYYYYWFGGRRLLARPLDEMLASGRPDFPFCVCWANENWTRRWDGAEDEILVRQDHSPESDLRFILDVIPMFRDPRYIHYDGKPMLLVYRAGIMEDPRRTTDTWRTTCAAHGIPDIHLVAAQTFGLVDPTPLGFDAAVEFPPHGIEGHRLDHRVSDLHPEFRGKIHDYQDAVDVSLARPAQPYHLHRCVMASWDNTPRRLLSAHVWHRATPAEYERWLRGVVEAASLDPNEPDPVVFINAWNEWAEGAHLEPDEVWGHAYLFATRRALLAGSPGPPPGSRREDLEGLSADELRARLERLEREVEGQRRANAALRAELEIAEFMERPRTTALAPFPPAWLPQGAPPPSGQIHLDELGPCDARGRLVTGRGRRLRVRGWAVGEGIDPAGKDAGSCLVLLAADGARAYFAPLRDRVRRPDVVEAFARTGQEVPLENGFEASVWYEGVEPGTYRLGVAQAEGERVVLALAERLLEIPAEE